jgi:DNA-binding transcriptional MerR regulator
MLTISQLASYAGVTVRAVRHYHAKGLLPEPERDHSGYRRYNAAAVVELIRIRTLAHAGVPLSRVQELLAAGDEEFAAALADIDRRLRAEIVSASITESGLANSPRVTAWSCHPKRSPTSTGCTSLASPRM